MMTHTSVGLLPCVLLMNGRLFDLSCKASVAVDIEDGRCRSIWNAMVEIVIILVFCDIFSFLYEWPASIVENLVQETSRCLWRCM